MVKQVIRPSVLPVLKDALSQAFWFKRDLRIHLRTCLPENQLIAQLDWAYYKRNVVGQLVDTMAIRQDLYLDDLLSLILSTAEITDPAWLKSVDDGLAKYAQGVSALKSLRDQVEPYRRLRDQADEADRRRAQERNRAEFQRAVAGKVDELRADFYSIAGVSEQKRGYALEKFLNQLFAVFDIDAKAPFKLVGQQIDGAFTLDGTVLVEVKWQPSRTPTADLMIFAGKVRGKLDDTLGLFLSMSGFEETAVSQGADGRTVMMLMDGADLSAVLENRIELPQLLKPKRQHARPEQVRPFLEPKTYCSGDGQGNADYVPHAAGWPEASSRQRCTPSFGMPKSAPVYIISQTHSRHWLVARNAHSSRRAAHLGARGQSSGVEAQFRPAGV